MEAVFELLPYASGLARNIQQCLNDFDIPLYLNTTVVEVHGRERVTGVTVARVDENRRPVPGSEQLVPCDTLLLSVGLIPENELSTGADVALAPRTNGALVDEHCMTSIPGVFSCGNVLHVHDLVDHVSQEAARAGVSAVRYLDGDIAPLETAVSIAAGKGIGYVLPQKTGGREDFTLSLRVTEPFAEKAVLIRDGDRKVARKKLHRLHPAEMIRIKVKAEKIQNASRLEAVIE